MARILLRKPEIIILDEAFNNLDEITYKTIKNIIFKSFKDKTMIIVSHKIELQNEIDNIIEI